MHGSRWAIALGILFLVVIEASVANQVCATQTSLGENLVRELWSDMKARNVLVLEEKIAPGFQSVHEDGARNREEELKLVGDLDLGEYTLSDFKATQVGEVIIVSYFVSTKETIGGKHLFGEPAARMSIFLKTESTWQWIAHANLKPLN